MCPNRVILQHGFGIDLSPILANLPPQLSLCHCWYSGGGDGGGEGPVHPRPPVSLLS